MFPRLLELRRAQRSARGLVLSLVLQRWNRGSQKPGSAPGPAGAAAGGDCARVIPQSRQRALQSLVPTGSNKEQSDAQGLGVVLANPSPRVTEQSRRVWTWSQETQGNQLCIDRKGTGAS